MRSRVNAILTQAKEPLPPDGRGAPPAQITADRCSAVDMDVRRRSGIRGRDMFGKRVAGNPWPLFGDEDERAGAPRERDGRPGPARAVEPPAAPRAAHAEAGRVRALPAPRDVGADHRAGEPGAGRDPLPEPVALTRQGPSDAPFDDTRRMMADAICDAVDLDELDRLSARRAREEIADMVHELNASRGLGLSGAALERLAAVLADDLVGLGPLEALIARPDVEEIRVTTYDFIQVDVRGRWRRADLRFRDATHFSAVCRRLAARVGRCLDADHPICDAPLPDGARMTIIAPPASAAPVLRVRQPRPLAATLEHLIRDGALSPRTADVLALAVRCGCSILVAGPEAAASRGAGGAARLLNALVREIDDRESLVVIEDVRRLSAPHADAVRLIAAGDVDADARLKRVELVRAAVRLGADRLVIDPLTAAETAEALQAMAGAHRGSLAAVTAAGARAAAAHMEAAVAAGLGTGGGHGGAVRALIAGAIDLIIETDGDGVVTRVVEIAGLEEDALRLRDMLAPVAEHGGGELRFTGEGRPGFWPRVRAAGLEDAFADALRAAR